MRGGRGRRILAGLFAALIFAGALALTGCRGMKSENRPIHPNLNMDFQEKYQAQEANDLFADGRAMRQPPPGAVPRGFLRDDVRFYTGRTEGGQYVDKVPVPVTRELLQRGQERFNIYCAVCHGQAGDGQGIIMTGGYGYVQAPTYHKAALRDTADGYFFNVITNGVRNMPGYAQQIPIADRWAIVTYIRALQRSQNSTREDVPPSVLARIEQTGSANMNAARDATGRAAPGGGAGTTSGTGSAGTEATESPAPASNTAAAGEGAASDTSEGEVSAVSPTGAADDTTAAAPSTPTAASDTALADTTTVAGTTEDASPEGVSVGGADAEDGGSLFGSTFLIVVIVVLPIAVLMVVLVAAFRRDREH